MLEKMKILSFIPEIKCVKTMYAVTAITRAATIVTLKEQAKYNPNAIFVSFTVR